MQCAEKLTLCPELDKEKVMRAYEKDLSYTASHLPTYKEFVLNMEEKLHDGEFLSDTDMILKPGTDYRPEEAYRTVHDNLIVRLKSTGGIPAPGAGDFKRFQ